MNTDILFSAATGATVSAVIIQLGLFFERKQKDALAERARKDLIFQKAIEMAVADRELDLEIAKRGGRNILPPLAITVTKHFEYLLHIYENGTIPPEVIELTEKQIEKDNQRRFG